MSNLPKTYVDNKSSLSVSGVDKISVGSSTVTLSVPLAMGNNKITGLATPTNSTDSATKAYVDASGAVRQLLFVSYTGNYTNGTTNFATGSSSNITSLDVTTTTGKVLITAVATGKIISSADNGELAITFNGVDYTVAAFTSASGTAEYHTVTIEQYVTGLTPGSYTAELRGKVTIGGTFAIRTTTDTPYARATIRIMEIN